MARFESLPRTEDNKIDWLTLRLSLEMSQREIADAMGIDAGVYGAMERGTSVPQLRNRRSIRKWVAEEILEREVKPEELFSVAQNPKKAASRAA